jgi:transcriptional regulator with XRE-family HTH domain
MSFGQRLKTLREEKGLTQEELGKIIGVSDVAILQYEKGKRRPDLDKLILFSNYFECSIDYLAGKTDIKEPKSEYSISIEKIEKIKNKKLSISDLNKFLDFIDSIDCDDD